MGCTTPDKPSNGNEDGATSNSGCVTIFQLAKEQNNDETVEGCRKLVVFLWDVMV